MKYHFTLERGNACGRDGKVITDRVRQVTCLNCQNSSEYLEAKLDLDAQRKAAFDAQIPTEVREPWQNEKMSCRECSGVLFRHGDRTCYGHYDNFHCASCGHVESRLTETGMSF